MKTRRNVDLVLFGVCAVAAGFYIMYAGMYSVFYLGEARFLFGGILIVVGVYALYSSNKKD